MKRFAPVALVASLLAGQALAAGSAPKGKVDQAPTKTAVPAQVIAPVAGAADDDVKASDHLKYKCDLTERVGDVWSMAQGTEGRFFRTSDLNINVIIDDWTVHKIGRLNALLKAQGNRLIYLPIPPRVFVNGANLDKSNPMMESVDSDLWWETYLAALKKIESVGMPVVDMGIDGMPDDVRKVFFQEVDLHWSNFGSEWAASRFADLLRSMGQVLPDPPNSTLSEAKLVLNPPSFRFIKSRCVGVAGRLELPQFEVKRTAQKASDLFDDAVQDQGQIDLIGSSFSADRFSLPAFIEHKSGMPVRRLNVEGGEFTSAMISYFLAEYRQAPKNTTVLWESQFYPFANYYNQLREFSASAAGVCDGAELIARNGQAPVDGSGEAVAPPEGTPVSGENYYVALDFGSLAATTVRVKVEYRNGEIEFMDFDHSAPMRGTGQFFRDFDDAIDAPIKSIRVMSVNAPVRSADVRICRNKVLSDLRMEGN